MPPIAHEGGQDGSMSETLGRHFEAAAQDTRYIIERQRLLSDEKAHVSAWQEPARSNASTNELKAQEIILKIREHERKDEELFGNLPGEAVPDDEKTRDMGGRFLRNLERIEKSSVFNIAKQAPKGCHLHIHFNSELDPEPLFGLAKELVPETMFVRCTRALREEKDFRIAEIVFNVMPAGTSTSNVFADDYNPDVKVPGNSPWMNWQDFCEEFPKQPAVLDELLPKLDRPEMKMKLGKAENWAREKMVITNSKEHGTSIEPQTHNGAWACFNIGTRAFKGLLNYQSIYTKYIGLAIDNMVKQDKIMYCEMRPMLLDKSIPTDDGKGQLNHAAQMKIICSEVKKKQDELEKQGRLDDFPFGIKIIYCTPRSIPRARMQAELQDCLKLKLEFPDLICGFDLVGAEDRPNSISFYADLLVAFAKTCDELSIKIPFMFHAGETLLDTGGSDDPDKSNLYDSLLLNAKRIGHGYALLKHPLLVERYKERGICLELCPISNELLHLCGNVREHPFPELLAAGLHCTLNSDNPSLFRSNATDSSSLSHEFYQVMVGDTRMTLHGWRQLVEWSVQHSCLDEEQQRRAMKILAAKWEAFCQWVVGEYGEYARKLPVSP
ncbi:hypothetical protein MBLNU230_g7089t1 [Neophaeotheca triangularis]